MSLDRAFEIGFRVEVSLIDISTEGICLLNRVLSEVDAVLVHLIYHRLLDLLDVVVVSSLEELVEHLLYLHRFLSSLDLEDEVLVVLLELEESLTRLLEAS